MLTLGKNEVAKCCTEKYICTLCDYSTSRKSSYDKHILTAKHKRVTMVTERNHLCPCGKLFNCRQHLYRHKKICTNKQICNAKVAKVAISTKSSPKISLKNECICGNSYKHASSLSKHKKTCLHITKTIN